MARSRKEIQRDYEKRTGLAPTASTIKKNKIIQSSGRLGYRTRYNTKA